MVAFIYLVTAFGSRPPSFLAFASTLALFMIASVGIASFGQLTNDLMDIQQDLRSGTHNTMANLGFVGRVWLFAFVILLGLFPWIWLPTNGWILSLVALEYLLFVLYSFPPVRLKARGLLGPVADSAYAYVITNAVAILVFAELSDLQISRILLLVSVWTFLFGLGHIIQHQLLDVDRDQIAGINTFVSAEGWQRSFNLLRNVILPVEFVLFISLLFLAGSSIPIVFVFFFYHIITKAQWWRRNTFKRGKIWAGLSRIDQYNLLSNEVMARFAWYWLPPLSLLILITTLPAYWPLAFLHLLLFPKPVGALKRLWHASIGRNRSWA
jgi:1,4-dihydroxy-2-naphthoate octaprenyltransferase